jgi:hypothetical protein
MAMFHPKKKAMGLSHGLCLNRLAKGSLSWSAHGLFLLLSAQAMEHRPVPKAKIAKIKETNLLFSCHRHCSLDKKIAFIDEFVKSQKRKKMSC